MDDRQQEGYSLNVNRQVDLFLLLGFHLQRMFWLRDDQQIITFHNVPIKRLDISLWCDIQGDVELLVLSLSHAANLY